MWTWKVSGGVPFRTRFCRAAWATEPAPPAIALLVTKYVGLSQLNLLMMALKPLDSPPVVHQETASISVAPACFVQMPPAAAEAAELGVAVLLEHAEATRAATEITAIIRRDGSFTECTSLTLDEPMTPSLSC